MSVSDKQLELEALAGRVAKGISPLDYSTS
jgi:hypothetical protein